MVGRPTNTDRMIKALAPKADVASFGSEPLIIPNHSGQHEAGRIDNVQNRDNAIANKKYVDDQIISVGDGRYLKLDASNDPITGVITTNDSRTTTDGTITRDGSDNITSIAHDNRTITINRDVDGIITGWEDADYEWTLTRTSGLVTSWSVTEK